MKFTIKIERQQSEEFKGNIITTVLGGKKGINVCSHSLYCLLIFDLFVTLIGQDIDLSTTNCKFHVNNYVSVTKVYIIKEDLID